MLRDKDKDRMGWYRNFVIDYAAEIDKNMHYPIDAIIELLSYPRILKHTLRRTLVLWKKLAMEINFDDLLIVNVLKTVDERYFSFIDKNISRLQYLLTGGDKRTQEDLNNRLQKEFRYVFEGIKNSNEESEKSQENKMDAGAKTSSQEIEAAKELLMTLFPNFFSKEFYEGWPSEASLTYQHVAQSEPTKYWERIKRGELYEGEISDCKILKAINKWNADFENEALDNMDMVGVLTKEDQVIEKLRQFKKLINSDCIRKAASKQFETTLEVHRNKACAEVCDAAGQWFVLGPDNIDDHWQQWLYEEIKKALPISLRYVNDLYYHWYKPKQNQDGQFREKIIEAAKDIYESNPDLLGNALDPDNIWSVWDFACLVSQTVQGGNGFKPEEWKWLGQVLLKAGEKYPKVIGPNIARLLVIVDRDSPYNQFVLKSEFIEPGINVIFNNHMKAVMSLLLLKGIDLEKYDHQSKEILQFTRDYANKWFNERNNQNNDGNSQQTL